MDTIDGENSHHELGIIVVSNGRQFGNIKKLLTGVPRVKIQNWCSVPNNKGSATNVMIRF